MALRVCADHVAPDPRVITDLRSVATNDADMALCPASIGPPISPEYPITNLASRWST